MTAGPELRFERRIAARPADVYAFLTESRRWARWQGVAAEIDAVADGTFRVEIGNGAVSEGRFLEVVPNRRVVFTWGWRGSATLPPGSSTVEIELEPDGDGTRLILTHRGLPAEERRIHDIGWTHYLPRLEVAATGGDPGPDSVPRPPGPD